MALVTASQRSPASAGEQGHVRSCEGKSMAASFLHGKMMTEINVFFLNGVQGTIIISMMIKNNNDKRQSIDDNVDINYID